MKQMSADEIVVETKKMRRNKESVGTIFLPNVQFLGKSADLMSKLGREFPDFKSVEITTENVIRVHFGS
jgi:hypothetical protein